MTARIFRYVFATGAIALVLCTLLMFGVEYREGIDEAVTMLRQETEFVSRGLELSGEDYVRDLDTDRRICWIGTDGKLILDTKTGDDKTDAEASPEVQAAFEEGSGEHVGASAAFGVTLICAAVRLEDGSVVRLSAGVRVLRLALQSVSPILWIFVLVLIVAGLLAFKASKQIVKPINELDLDHPENIQSYPEIEPLVNRLREQNLTIVEQYEAREQMRQEFSANVSHELKTPLTSITGFAELIEQGMVPEEKMMEFAGDIKSEANRLLALIEDIIQLSRLDENEGLPDSEIVDLYELSEEVVKELRPAADKNNISLKIEGPHVQLNGVKVLLRETLENLVDNAIKYNRYGGSVTVKLAEAEDGITLAVQDTGIGIPEKDQARVFERFYRVDKSHSRRVGGTGLGLSIVKHAALYHNAKVSLKSRLGEGTEITLAFPSSKEHAEA